MAAIHVQQFSGIAPRFDPRDLKNEMAQLAQDVDMRGTNLRPKQTHRLLSTRGHQVATIFDVPECGILTWDEQVDIADGLFSPADHRLYWSDIDGVHTADAVLLCQGTYYKLGLPCPLTAPQASNGSASGTCAESRAYVYTYVTVNNEEGPPSPPSNQISCNDGDTISLDGLTKAPIGHNITAIRVYRTSTGFKTGEERQTSHQTAFHFVGEVGADGSLPDEPEWPGRPDDEEEEGPEEPFGAGLFEDHDEGGVETSYSDRLRGTQLGESLQTARYFEPPAGMKNLVMLQHGVLAGSVGKVVHLSEPHQYHAFPQDRDLLLDDEIVAMAEHDRGLYVLTTGSPYLITIADGENGPTYVVYRHPRPEPCVSKLSVVSTPSGVFWASTDGMYLMKGTTVTKYSEPYYTLREWAEVSAETMQATFFEDALLCFTSVTGLRFDLGDRPELTTLTDRPDALYTKRNGDLLIAVGNTVLEWGADPVLRPLTWRSKQHVNVGRVAYTAAKVLRSAVGDLVFRIYRHMNGTSRLIHEYAVANDVPFRLPAVAGVGWSFELEGNAEVYEVHIGTSMQDLAAQ